METILRVESLKKHYGKEPNITKALNGISFQVVKGEFLGIMGSSGSGKTTLLNCLATIIKPTDGSIQIQEKDLGQLKGSQLADYRGKEIGYLFQNFELLDNLTANFTPLVFAQGRCQRKQGSVRIAFPISRYF